MNTKFRTFDEFFLFYLRQHSNRANRQLHVCGTAVGVAVVIAAFVFHHPWFALLWIPVGYGFAWTGHFLLERNRPATWGHPWWSLLSDFRMIGLMLIGRLDKWIAQAEASQEERAAAAAQD